MNQSGGPYPNANQSKQRQIRVAMKHHNFLCNKLFKVTPNHKDNRKPVNGSHKTLNVLFHDDLMYLPIEARQRFMFVAISK